MTSTLVPRTEVGRRAQEPPAGGFAVATAFPESIRFNNRGVGTPMMKLTLLMK